MSLSAAWDVPREPWSWQIYRSETIPTSNSGALLLTLDQLTNNPVVSWIDYSMLAQLSCFQKSLHSHNVRKSHFHFYEWKSTVPPMYINPALARFNKLVSLNFSLNQINPYPKGRPTAVCIYQTEVRNPSKPLGRSTKNTVLPTRMGWSIYCRS